MHLHEELKRRATCAEDPGIPVVLRKCSRVVEVDPLSATAVLETGETVQGDLLIGADGVHVSDQAGNARSQLRRSKSMTRSKVPGGDLQTRPSGKSAFRFLVPRKAALADPNTTKFAQKHGELIIWYGRDRRVVMYPCADNEQLNFVCIHPRSESEATQIGELIKPPANETRNMG